MPINEAFLSDLIQDRVLTGDKKKEIQTVCEFISKRLCLTGILLIDRDLHVSYFTDFTYLL